MGENNAPAVPHGLPAVRSRIAPALNMIREGALSRENNRELPFAAVERLREAGFGSVRIPAAYGGDGLSFGELVDLLVEVARADSNVAQVFRGHIGFVEHVLTLPDGADRDFWLTEIASGAVVGNAHSERAGSAVTAPQATVTDTDGEFRLTGRKFYSTGSIFADWIYTNAYLGDEYVTALVRSQAPGVERIDDWDGFGQRMTGSGTTIFDNTPIEPRHLHRVTGNVLPVTALNAIYQIVHLATLSGIAAAARDEAIEYVNQRERGGIGALTPVPREDPQVQQVIGEVATSAYAAAATTRAAAAAIDRVQGLEGRGMATDDDYARTDTEVFLAQGAVIDHTLRATTDLFKVGGSSATSTSRGLDRLWRNARTIASHNAEVIRARTVGAFLLGGSAPAALSYAPEDSDKVTDDD
ncbi:alkylation response protein AidB-like acyl-CoA dehydrogenase [Rhodococcus sp. 27YEA15]|uniref:acyl-CoA dehydrogenase family protein n=1 Tax=Rhodococcus sp. 27YEA15 TaxID=3156259 RepID=UPI003C7E9623